MLSLNVERHEWRVAELAKFEWHLKWLLDFKIVHTSDCKLYSVLDSISAVIDRRHRNWMGKPVAYTCSSYVCKTLQNTPHTVICSFLFAQGRGVSTRWSFLCEIELSRIHSGKCAVSVSLIESIEHEWARMPTHCCSCLQTKTPFPNQICQFQRIPPECAQQHWVIFGGKSFILNFV